MSDLFKAETSGQTKLLLEASIDSNNRNRITLLMWVSAKEIKLLLDEGADPNISDIHGNTPLIYSKTAEETKLLLDAGADINVRNKDERKAIHYAKSADMLRVLIEYGADPEAKDKDGNTPLKLFSENDPRAVFLKELGVEE